MPHIKQPTVTEREYQDGVYELFPEGLVTGLYAQIHQLEEDMYKLACQVDTYRENELELRYGKRPER